LGQFAFRQRESFADFHGSGPVIQTDDNQMHGQSPLSHA
jgi:hypothetical protein